MTRQVLTVYGIPNCDQVKKARHWLDAHQVAYSFHDVKKLGLAAELVRAWIAQAGAARVINRQGTTWRALDDSRKALADEASGAVALICEQPSLVRRPLLLRDGTVVAIGFNPDHFSGLFP